jgi:hypothetical protein
MEAGRFEPEQPPTQIHVVLNGSHHRSNFKIAFRPLDGSPPQFSLVVKSVL